MSAALFGLSGPNSIYLTLAGNGELDGTFTALGRVVAGSHVLGDFAAEDQFRSIRILRSGEMAQAFMTDNDAFQRLLRGR